MNASFLITISIALQICQLLPSKPGSFHSPPDSVYIGKDIVLEWKHIIRGYQGSGARLRYSDEHVYYRVRGEAGYREAQVVRTAATSQFVTIKATIPAIHAREGAILEYYCTRRLDGNKVHAQHGPDNPQTIPFRKHATF